MNTIDNPLLDAVREQQKKVDKIIANAFKRHFGFPFEDIKNPENLEHLIPPTSQGYEALRYRGETFMYIERLQIRNDPYRKGVQVMATTRYIEA